jgi:heavy metal response regulator
VRILLVEDDRKVASFIRKGLSEEGYAVDVAYDGDTGLLMGLDRLHDVIILDVLLPGKPGFQVVRELRQAKVRTPVLLLTARDAVEDKVQGLDDGADDYLTKPFAFAELLARVRALLRRGTAGQAALLQVADLTLDPATRTAKRAGETIPLTNREFALLEYLLRNAGRVLTRTMIAEHVWDYSFDAGTNVIDVYVNYLRKKIDAGREPKLIHTVRGAGYVLKAEPRAGCPPKAGGREPR